MRTSAGSLSSLSFWGLLRSLLFLPQEGICLVAGLAGCSEPPSPLSPLLEDCEVGLRCPREISFQGMYNQSYSEQGGFVGEPRGLGLNSSSATSSCCNVELMTLSH